MSAYVKFVCDYCGNNEVEFWGMDPIETTLSCLEYYGWDSSDGYMCDLCRSFNV